LWIFVKGRTPLRASLCVHMYAHVKTQHAVPCAGWVALWHTTMKDVGFFRELLGLNK
jgi:hypothetical protein